MKFDTVLKKKELPIDNSIKLAVTMCSSRDIKPQTTASLVNLVAWLVHSSHSINMTRLDLVGGVSESLLSTARQKKLDFAIEGTYTHLVCFDDDMQFPYDAVHRMLAADVDFICANAVQKLPDKINGVCLDFAANRIDSTGKTGVEEIGWGSLACAVIKMDAIRKIPKPHFEVNWVQELHSGLGGYQGEDHYFINKLKAHGIKIHCDHDLSNEVFHIGDYKYGFPEITQFKG